MGPGGTNLRRVGTNSESERTNMGLVGTNRGHGPVG